MHVGKSIQEFAAEIARQNDVKADYLAPSNALALEPFAGGVQLALKAHGENAERKRFAVGEVFHDQLATHLGVPAKYWDRMRKEAPELLAENANHWLQLDTRRRMVRTLDGQARAYLSDSYRPLDNFELCQAVLPVVADQQLSIKSCEVTERRLYIQAVSPRVEGEVKRGDVVQAGFVISNSEIGHGSLRIERMVYRLVCLNGAIMGDAMRKYHVGRSAKGDLVEEVAAYYRDSTRRLDDAAFFAKVTDTVRHLISQEAFDAQLAQLQGAASIAVKPLESVELIAKRFELTEGERGSMLQHLIAGGDLSAWGVANAVTRLAHDAADYDRSVELEKLGGEVVELKRSDWSEVLAAA